MLHWWWGLWHIYVGLMKEELWEITTTSSGCISAAVCCRTALLARGRLFSLHTLCRNNSLSKLSVYRSCWKCYPVEADFLLFRTNTEDNETYTKPLAFSAELCRCSGERMVMPLSYCWWLVSSRDSTGDGLFSAAVPAPTPYLCSQCTASRAQLRKVTKWFRALQDGGGQVDQKTAADMESRHVDANM